MSTKEKITYLDYDSISAYFTYSFIVDINDSNYPKFVEKALGKKWKSGIPESRIGVTSITSPLFKSDQNDWDGSEDTNQLKNISNKDNSNVIYNELSIFKELEEECFNCTFHQDGSNDIIFKVSIEPVMRIFFNGSGCLTFKVSYSDQNETDLKWIHIKSLLALSKRSKNADFSKLSKENSKPDEKNLYELFIKELTNQVKSLELTLECDSIEQWDYYILKKFNDGWSPQNPNVYLDIQVNDTQIFEEYSTEISNYESLYKKHLELSDLLLNIIPESDKEPTIQTSNYESLYKKHLELSNLLLNIIPESDKEPTIQINNTKIPISISDKNQLIKNLAWDRRLFISILRQISFHISNNNDKPKDNYIHRSILDAVELLHARWFFNITMNSLLDQEINRIKLKPSSNNLEILENLIKKRKLFAYFLHDPISYRYWGGAVTDLVNEAEKHLWINKLKEMTYRKFQIIDQLYDDHMEYLKMESYNKIYKTSDYKSNLIEVYENLQTLKKLKKEK